VKLVVGLGNPSAEYESTRHNVGFRVVDEVSSVSGIKVTRKKHGSVFGRGRFCGEDIILAKPLTYVNLSGKAVKSLARYYRLNLEDMLVVYDDMDLPLGRIRLRDGGSSAGHRGMDSIIEELGDSRFPRLRIGISKMEGGKRGKEFVLGRFSGEEEEVIGGVVKLAVQAVRTVVSEGLAAAMNRFNERPAS